ncbi:MAG: hypothetical protein HYX63_05570 [Gammaproteobacteria bacterium]|nr:hypothetical protein [Gammaproteobacteria bacterium]
MTKLHLNLDEFPTLANSRVYSLELISQLERAIASRAPMLTPLLCVAAGGSLGRLEARLGSDLDSIMLYAPGAWAPLAGDEVASILFFCAAECGLKAPKPWGIYRTPIKPETLWAASSFGDLDEAPSVFGTRIQLLLDARPLYGHASFKQVRREILCWYAAPATFGMDDRWAYLRRDLARYVNAYTNWQLFKLERSVDDSWLVRQAKLRSSRFLTWLGLWLVLDSLDQLVDPAPEIIDALFDLTPLERVARTMGYAAPALFRTLLVNYERVMTIFAEPEARHELLQRGPEGVPSDARGVSKAFDSILVATDNMRSAVGQFMRLSSRPTLANYWL